MEYLQYLLSKILFFVQSCIVLNLVISGIPSILIIGYLVLEVIFKVLNLVISGIPSIHDITSSGQLSKSSFKPCYKWNTFNTGKQKRLWCYSHQVLNLVISGIPSILDLLKERVSKLNPVVLNLVISGIPSIPLICIRVLILW